MQSFLCLSLVYCTAPRSQKSWREFDQSACVFLWAVPVMRQNFASQEQYPGGYCIGDIWCLTVSPHYVVTSQPCVHRQAAEPHEHPYRCLLHRTTHKERRSENSRMFTACLSRILMERKKILKFLLRTLMFCLPERAVVSQIWSCFSGWNTNYSYQRQWDSCWWRSFFPNSDYPS